MDEDGDDAACLLLGGDHSGPRGVLVVVHLEQTRVGGDISPQPARKESHAQRDDKDVLRSGADQAGEAVVDGVLEDILGAADLGHRDPGEQRRHDHHQRKEGDHDPDGDLLTEVSDDGCVGHRQRDKPGRGGEGGEEAGKGVRMVRPIAASRSSSWASSSR